jgi:hypothetical protein
MIRRKKEIQEHGNDLDSMLNDDYNRDQKSLDNDSRKTFISENCKHLFISYLDSNKIKYKQQQDGDYSLKKDDSKKLYDLLTPLKYTGKNATTRIQQKKALRALLNNSYKFTFESIPEMKSNLNLLSISSPLLKIIANQSLCDFSDVSLVGSKLDGSFAVVYKSEFKSFKETSRHRVLVLDENLMALQDIDYFDFYEGSSSMNSVFDTSKLVEAKSAAQKIISEDFNQSLDHEKLVAKETLNKKKDALQLHFKKKRDMAKKAGQKAFQEDIIRMRQSQIDNINDLERERIMQLENKMKVNGSFQILSILKLSKL